MSYLTVKLCLVLPGLWTLYSLGRQNQVGPCTKESQDLRVEVIQREQAVLAPWFLAHALIPALQRHREPNLGYIASSESARATECSCVCKQNTLAPAICLLCSSLPKNLSDEDVLRDLLIQELLAWMVDQTELCRLRWGARGHGGVASLLVEALYLLI